MAPELPSLQDVEQYNELSTHHAWNPSCNLSEKVWQHGWGIDGYPYLSPQSHFLIESRTESSASKGKLRPPAWAPHYGYPEALVKPAERLAEPNAHADKDLKDEVNDSVERWVQDAAVKHLKLPEDVLEVLDEVVRSFKACDREGFMTALERLKQFEEKLCSKKDLQVRNSQLLEAYAGRVPLQPQATSRLQDVEKELVQRLARVVSQDPESAKRFVEDFPEPIRTIIEPYRMAREASEIAPPRRRGTSAATGTEQQHHFKWKKSPPLPGYPPYQLVEKEPAQRAVTTVNLTDKEPRLSQAVLQLPNTEEKWERRWEQDLVWHPGILYAAHQAPPHVR